MAVKRVIIHLGMARTGSASIQYTLFSNSNILEKYNFRYLTEWGRNQLGVFRHLFSPYPVDPVGSGSLGKPFTKIRKKNRENIKKMVKVINDAEFETLILSGEYFDELWLDSTIENIKSFIQKYFHSNGIETKIVYFVRNPLTWLISSLQQQIFSKGYLNKNGDYFENRIKQYEGVFNLIKHFSDSLILIKFEDACLDKDGLVGHFLKAISFPEEELKNINILRKNESRCMEVVEFINYIESAEPRHPYNNYKYGNPSRSAKDLKCLMDIKGIKYDLPYQSKIELWHRFIETIHLLKKNTGIDYTDYKVPPPSPCEEEAYNMEALQGFIEAFPKLNISLQRHFLKFFEKKYMETAQIRFKQLHYENSIPWKIYKNRNVFFDLLCLRAKNRLRNRFKK